MSGRILYDDREVCAAYFLGNQDHIKQELHAAFQTTAVGIGTGIPHGR